MGRIIIVTLIWSDIMGGYNTPCAARRLTTGHTLYSRHHHRDNDAIASPAHDRQPRQTWLGGGMHCPGASSFQWFWLQRTRVSLETMTRLHTTSVCASLWTVFDPVSTKHVILFLNYYLVSEISSLIISATVGGVLFWPPFVRLSVCCM